VLAGRARGLLKASRHDGVSLSLEDFSMVVTAALREKERERRRAQFAREQEVRLEADFGPLEVEDLRELHRVLLRVEVEGNRDVLAKLLVLFHGCGIRELSRHEISGLRHIVRQGAKEPEAHMLETVPFELFMTWMQGVFEQGIGDLQFTGQETVTVEDLEQRRGFAAAMLREHLRVHRPLPPISAASVRNKRSSQATIASSASASASRRASGSLHHRTSLGLAWAMGKVWSKGTPRRGSRTTSRSGSRSSFSNSNSNSMAVTPAPSGPSAGGNAEERSRVMGLSSLPPSEAMLGRKPFRAISVDLTNDGSVNNLGLSEVSNSPMSSAQPRQVKTGQDSDALVNDAMAKLFTYQREEDDDDDEEGAEGSTQEVQALRKRVLSTG